MNCSPFQSPEFLYTTVVFVWFSGVAQAEKGAVDPMEAKKGQAMQAIMGIEPDASLLTHMQKLAQYAYFLYSFILNFVWFVGAVSLVHVDTAPAAGDYGEPDSRYEGQKLLAGHYICPAAHAHFINSSYYAADPSAFEFTADGTWSFDYIYVSTVITFFFFALCSCANAVANKILRTVSEETGGGFTMR